MTRPGHTTAARFLLLVGMLLLVVGSAAFLRKTSGESAEFGAAWAQSASGPIVVHVEPESPAERSGLRPGDRLVRAGGRPVDSRLDAEELAWLLREAVDERLIVDRAGVEVELVAVPLWERSGPVYTYLAIVGLAFWLSGSFILWRWPSVRGGLVYPPLAYLLFTLLVFSHSGQADPFDWWVFWIDVLASAVAPAAWIHLALVLGRRGRAERRRFTALAYGFAGAIAAVAVWLISGGALRFADPVAAVEWIDRVAFLYLGLAIVASTALLVRSFERTGSALHRGQIRWVLWGIGIGLTPVVLLELIPWSLGLPELPVWARFVAVFPILFVPAALTAALARYRLHDLDVLLIRGVTEVTALLCTFAVYAASLFVMRELLDGVLPPSRRFTRYIGFVIAALSWPQLRQWTRSGVERAFYRKRYSYRATLLDWARDLNSETDLIPLIENLRGRIRDTLGIPEARVYLRRDVTCFEAPYPSPTAAAQLELTPARVARLVARPYLLLESGELPAAPWARYLIALKVKGQLRALLAIAERESPEEPLSSEDRALLVTLSAQAASAIESARLVTEVRRHAEEAEALAAREAKILDSSAVGLMLLDGDGQVLTCNRALESIYGITREEAVGRRLAQILPLQIVQQVERQARDAAEVRLFRLRMVNRRSEPIVVNLAISAAEADGSRVVTVDDVTERVKLEEQLLRQERLASLGLLAAGVAHEINTPLTGISSYTQLLLEDEASGDRRDLLDKIEQQTRRATEITRSLLNLARPEEAALDALELNATVEEVLRLFEPQIRGRGIGLQVELSDQPLGIRGDKARLQQVLLNLLINARDAVGESGTITVCTARRDDRPLIEVVDDGPGISDEDMQRIFDPFFTTKQRGKGTGLGLSICHEIVREHGAEMHVDSRPGEHTRFQVIFPAPTARRASGGGSA